LLYYISSNKSIVALILSVFLSLCIFFNNDSFLVNKVKGYWLELRWFITSPLIQINDFVNSKNDFDSIRLEKLKSDLKSLKYYNQESYLKYLESAIGLKNRFLTSDQNNFFSANVLSHSNPQISNSVVIDIGKQDFGLMDSDKLSDKNYIAIDVKGNLLGRIISMSKNTSIVQLINDVNNKVIVESKKNPDFTALMVPFSNSKCELLGVSLNSTISIGDTLSTSYKSDVYLEKIPVCHVINVSNDEGVNPFKKIFVEILADLSYIRSLFIIEVSL